MRQTLSFLCCYCLLAGTAQAGAWLQPKGSTLLVTQAGYFNSEAYWDADGESQDQSTFSKWEIQPYAEYGLTDTITVGGSVFLQRNTQAGSTNEGFADPEFFARTPLWKDATQQVAVQPLIKLPSAFRTGNDPRGGSESWDMELSLLYGTNLDLVSAHDYADIRFGYRERSGAMHGQYKADAAVGLNITDRITVIPGMHSVVAESIEDSTGFSQNGAMDYDLLKADLTTLYRLDDTRWVQASFFHHLSGKQTGSGQGVSIGYAASW